jgi:hypothetical protein
LGGGAVLRHKRPAGQSFGIDIDPDVIAWWRTHHPHLATYIVGDALTVLRNFPFSGSELIYCDPPYLPSTRKRSRVYRHDLGEDDHVGLLAFLKQLPCRVALSGYPSLLYRHALSGWNEFHFRAKAHDTTRDECIWTNYTAPDHLHDPRFLGRNFRQRQDRKRRLARIQNRIGRLSIQEQHVIVEWLEGQLNIREKNDAAVHIPQGR